MPCQESGCMRDCVAQLVAALIKVHGLLSFLSDVYGLLDTSGKTLWLSVNHRRLGPVNDMVLLSCVVWSARADSLCSVKLDARWLLVNMRLVFDSTAVLCSCNLTPNFLPNNQCRSCLNWHKELCTHILLRLPYPVCLLDVPVHL